MTMLRCSLVAYRPQNSCSSIPGRACRPVACLRSIADHMRSHMRRVSLSGRHRPQAHRADRIGKPSHGRTARLSGRRSPIPWSQAHNRVRTAPSRGKAVLRRVAPRRESGRYLQPSDKLPSPRRMAAPKPPGVSPRNTDSRKLLRPRNQARLVSNRLAALFPSRRSRGSSEPGRTDIWTA